MSGPLKDLDLGLWGPEGPGASRHLPDQELESDRWERARSLGFGEDCCVHHSSYIYGEPEIGSHVWIGPFVIVDASGGLEVGDFTMICAGVQVYSHDSVRWALSGGAVPPQKARVKIGSHCYIGAGSIVTRGVTVGDYTVVSAGSVVNRDLPPYSLAMGNPCRVVGKVIVEDGGRVHFAREE